LIKSIYIIETRFNLQEFHQALLKNYPGFGGYPLMNEEQYKARNRWSESKGILARR